MVIDTEVMQMRRHIERRLAHEAQMLSEARASLTALSPQGTLDRGYAMLKLPDGTLVRDAQDVAKGSLIEGILARGRLVAQVVGSTASAPSASGRADPSPRSSDAD